MALADSPRRSTSQRRQHSPGQASQTTSLVTVVQRVSPIRLLSLFHRQMSTCYHYALFLGEAAPEHPIPEG